MDRIKNLNFNPVYKELIFDIDITDYSNLFQMSPDEISLTEDLWFLMDVAISVLSYWLKEIYNFQKLFR